MPPAKRKSAAQKPPPSSPAPPASPFPDFARPSRGECRAALAALESMHPGWRSNDDDCHAEDSVASVTDCLVRTILSQNTTDATSMRAFRSLKATFADYDAVRTALPSKLAAAIREGGLADRKVAVIQSILNSVHAETGSTSLDHLRTWGDGERVKSYLTAFNGIGPKTASCVLAFAVGAPDFPVDVHVHRAATAVLGWAPKAAGRDATYAHLNARVPDDIKVRLHVLMVEHGKRCAACGGGRGGGEKGAADKAVGQCVLKSAVLAARAAETRGAVKEDPGLFSPPPPKKQRVVKVKMEASSPRAEASPARGGVADVKAEASPTKPTRSGGAGATPGGGRARRRL